MQAIKLIFSCLTVSHQHLLYKLSYYGIRGSLYNWIGDFLKGRQQQVLLNNESSYSCSVLSGVPQGSVLGSLLFLLYINDLPSKISSKIRLYADDVIFLVERIVTMVLVNIGGHGHLSYAYDIL